MMASFAWYELAAVAEIAGCYVFWSWSRRGQSILWVGPGLMSLVVFALALTRVGTSNAGRAYAAYGGIYIVASLLWLWFVEQVRPDRWDLIGAGFCLVGATLILFGPRGG